jgi:septum site-determining protein MinC
MSQAVVIKSNKYGIHLVLDRDLAFDSLLSAIVEKLKEAEKFFKNAQLAISFEGRKLTLEQENAIVDEINANTSIDIICIVDNNPEHEEYIRQQIEHCQAVAQQSYGINNVQFYHGTLRSGQSVESEAGLVIVGDVNPGATVSAYGSIVVLGAVKGNAYAGIGGDDRSFIFAMDMNPIQIGIGNMIAKSPDRTAGTRRRKRAKETGNNPQVAYARDGRICIETCTKELLSII